MREPLPRILHLGDPRLRLQAVPVGDVRDQRFLRESRQLKEVLQAFRAGRGFGRALAAPQLGFGGRFVALDLGEGPRVIVNPEIVARSDETFVLWDDCLSFPDLLVRVRRHCSICVRFLDEDGQLRVWPDLPRDRSELLQHEIDHLDGVLAVDRAEGPEPLLWRDVFEAG